jgi:hypothetical protein
MEQRGVAAEGLECATAGGSGYIKKIRAGSIKWQF